MDSHEWKAQVQSGDQQLSAKLLKTIQLEDYHQWQAQFKSPSSTLTLFTPEPSSNSENATITSTHLCPFPFPKMSLEQWQELQLQALIYKYMISGVSVPLELILPIRRCLLAQSLYCHQAQLHQHFGPSEFQSGYWGRSSADPEPGRCRRTDGKKWRCSRDAVKGQKYCERHVHRGRNRSRKHVEASSPSYISCFKTPSPSLGSAKEHQSSIHHVSLHSSEILPLNDKGTPEHKEVQGDLQNNSFNVYKCDRHVLRSFLDESPRQQGEFYGTGKAIHSASAAHSSVPVAGNSSSDFSLRLSTGNAPTSMPDVDGEAGLVQQTPANWLGWANTSAASMGGGPLAEALHPLTLSNSPTSVLQKQHGLNL